MANMEKQDFAREALSSVAEVRGLRWAEQVMRHLVEQWPQLRVSERAMVIARRKVADVGDPADVEYYARIFVRTAVERFAEIVDFLNGERAALRFGMHYDGKKK